MKNKTEEKEAGDTTVTLKTDVKELLRQRILPTETWNSMLRRLLEEHPKEAEPKLDKSKIIPVEEETKERLRQYTSMGKTWDILLNQMMDDIDRHSKEIERLTQHANDEKFKRINLQIALDESKGIVAEEVPEEEPKEEIEYDTYNGKPPTQEEVPEQVVKPHNVESLDEKLKREKEEKRKRMLEQLDEGTPMTDEDWAVE